MLGIKNNLMAENAARHLNKSYTNLASSVERLSSGLRINSAKDDAAGLAVRELIRGDIATFKQGSRNAADAVSMMQVAEGALGVIDDILIRMRELAEQAATGSYSSSQKDIMQAEFGELLNEIDRIAQNTDFNDNKLLAANGATFDITLGLGVGAGKMITLTSKQMDAEGLNLGGKREFMVSSEWVTSQTSTLMTNASTVTKNMIITFAAQDDLTIAFTNNEVKTLSQVVDAINLASQGSTEKYDAAEIVYSAATDMYTLKVSSRDAGDTTIDFDTSDANIEWQGLHADASIADTHFANTNGSTTDAVNIKTNSAQAITNLDAALHAKDEYRAELGYMMNRLEAAGVVVDIQAENLLAAESRISDVDVATEMAALTRNQVLAQAGVAMLGQANMMPQIALSLLR